jgi:hypothetical protein
MWPQERALYLIASEPCQKSLTNIPTQISTFLVVDNSKSKYLQLTQTKSTNSQNAPRNLRHQERELIWLNAPIRASRVLRLETDRFAVHRDLQTQGCFMYVFTNFKESRDRCDQRELMAREKCGIDKLRKRN